MMEDPQNPYNQSPTDKDPSNQGKQPTSGSQEQKIEELVNQTLERKQTTQYLDQLHSRVNWLTGLFAVAVIILGGGLAWVSYSLQQQREQFVQQNEDLESPENLERIEELDTQIQELQEQVLDPQRIERLENQLEQLQEQAPDSQGIERLEDQIDELNTAIENNQQQIESILSENQTQGLQEDSPE